MSEIKVAPPERFELTMGERMSPLWLKLKKHLEDQVAKAREQNDKIMTEPETAALRGKIAAYKQLLKLDRED